jgi:ankyrin repeat protein
MDQLIEARRNVDPHLPCGVTPMFIAVENGHVSVTEQLIEVRCNVDLQASCGVTALYVAAQNGHASVT